MIQWVWERASKAKHLDRIIIATDDERIVEAGEKFGAEVIKTSPFHNSGTERAAEVAQDITTPIIINIQGDEPLVVWTMIDDLVMALQDESISMATLMTRLDDKDLIHNSNIVKVAVDKDGFAQNFSRSPLLSKVSKSFFQHIGIYGYQRDFLLKYTKLPPTKREKSERLEQIRALEHGYKIKMIETLYSILSIDVPEDIIKLEKSLGKYDQ